MTWDNLLTPATNDDTSLEDPFRPMKPERWNNLRGADEQYAHITQMYAHVETMQAQLDRIEQKIGDRVQA